MDEPERWAAEDEPSLVRPYTLTAGRTESRINLPLEAPVETPGHAAGPAVAANRCAGTDREAMR